MTAFTCLEICAGAGGQSLGLEQAGFEHLAAVEIDPDACATLRLNRPAWKVVELDVHHFDGKPFADQVNLLAGGVPCPPFSIAGKQLGADDERDLFPQALRLAEEIRPDAVMLENVRGLSGKRFDGYRQQVLDELHRLGYETDWKLLHASDFGVPQLRPRFILVALQPTAWKHFAWPEPTGAPPTVGETLQPLMASDGWPGAEEWAARANDIGPTLVGGSRKHGGADLGPTRAKAAWLRLAVDAMGLADAPPTPETPVNHTPRFTVQMAAAIQGFPVGWTFAGRKTASYRQVGNAFPPPVAEAVGSSIMAAITAGRDEASRPVRLVSKAF